MLLSLFLVSNRWFHFLPPFLDRFMFIAYILLLNDVILLSYNFLDPKYHFVLEFRTIGISFPYGLSNLRCDTRVYFKMDNRKKIGTYSILLIMAYSLYIDNLTLFVVTFILPIIVHVLLFKLYPQK